MTTLALLPELSQDIERVAAHLLAHDPEHAAQRMAEIFRALRILVDHPRIGRPAPEGRRLLVIGRDSRGCVARYRYDPVADRVEVMALRAQREAGFVDR
jgi:toxin ParE1/3/4